KAVLNRRIQITKNPKPDPPREDHRQMLVRLAAPARSQPSKNSRSRFRTAPKHETKPRSKQSTLGPPSPGGGNLWRPSNHLSVWLTSLIAPSRISRPASTRSRVMINGGAIRSVE